VPVSLFHGDNTVELEAAVAAVRRSFAGPDAAPLDGSTVPLPDLAEACLTAGLFDPDRLVLVRDLHERIKARGGDGEEIERLLGSVPPTTTLILISPGMPADHRLVAMVRAVGGKVQGFTTPRKGELARWIMARGEAHGATVDRDAAEALAEMIGSNTQLLDVELEKLATYAGREKRVTGTMVEEMVGVVTQDSIFALVDAIADGNRGLALRLLRAQLATGSNPTEVAVYLIRMLARQMRILLRLRLGQQAGRPLPQILSDLGVRSYHRDRYVRQARRLSEARLRGSFDLLAGLEHDLKSSRSDPATGLDLLVSDLCS